jgi:tetratricopeptide (TPR) repeat protein
VVAVPNAALAQRKGQEFARQGLLILNFEPTPSKDVRLGRKAADEVRSRIGKLVNKREVEVISGGDIRYELTKSGLPPDTVLDISGMRALGRFMRADEFIIGAVERNAAGVRMSARLLLMRDPRMNEPLPAATGRDVETAAAELAKNLAAARMMLTAERRCENALRDGELQRALQMARDAVNAYPPGVIGRVCLLWALRANISPANEVLDVAREVLKVDSMNAHALEAGAIALDSLRRRDEAARLWLRLADTDSSNLELTERVVWSMVFGGNSRKAEPLIVRASDAHPESLTLLRLRWRVAFDNKNWPLSISTGETLLAKDSAATTDSLFFLRLASAYRANAQTYKAVEIASRGVDRFPGDARLYTLYTQFIKSESDTAIGRGLALFPKSAELLTMSAKDLRAKGKGEDALAAARKALAVDSTLERGELMIAQGEIELGRPDSALASLRRALVRGEDTALVAQFALARGNVLLRAANGTQNRDDYRLAMRFLGLADTLKRTQQTAFLIGVAAYSITRSALVDAPKMTVKTQSCELSHLAAETLPVAREGLAAGQEVSPEYAKQILDDLGQLEPYVQRQIDAFCTG